MSSTVLCILSAMARDDAQVNFRIPHELNERLKAAAAGSNRSVTAELVTRLQRTLDDDQARAAMAPPEEVAAMLGEGGDVSDLLGEIGAMAVRLRELSAHLRERSALQIDDTEAKKKPTKKKAS
jgi:hypothetical protein